MIHVWIKMIHVWIKMIHVWIKMIHVWIKMIQAWISLLTRSNFFYSGGYYRAIRYLCRALVPIGWPKEDF